MRRGHARIGRKDGGESGGEGLRHWPWGLSLYTFLSLQKYDDTPGEGAEVVDAGYTRHGSSDTSNSV